MKVTQKRTMEVTPDTPSSRWPNEKWNRRIAMSCILSLTKSLERHCFFGSTTWNYTQVKSFTTLSRSDSSLWSQDLLFAFFKAWRRRHPLQERPKIMMMRNPRVSEDRERSPKRRLRLQVLSLDVGCGFNHVARIMPLVSVFHRLLGA